MATSTRIGTTDAKILEILWEHVVRPEYTVRFNNAGVFGMPPTRVEAMYSPEMFGETPNAMVEVKP